MSVIDWITKVLLFCAGWLAGLVPASLAMWLIERLFGTDFNTPIVAGCLIGTFGVALGMFMLSMLHRGGTQE